MGNHIRSAQKAFFPEYTTLSTPHPPQSRISESPDVLARLPKVYDSSGEDGTSDLRLSSQVNAAVCNHSQRRQGPEVHFATLHVASGDNYRRQGMMDELRGSAVAHSNNKRQWKTQPHIYRLKYLRPRGR